MCMNLFHRFVTGSDMEQTCFKNLSRLCGEKGATAAGRTPHDKAKYAQLILKALGEDITSDNEKVHPPDVCRSCIKKLIRWWASAKVKKSAQISTEVHSCEIYGEHLVDVPLPRCQ